MHMLPSAEEEEYLGLINTCHIMKKIKNLGTFLSTIVLYSYIPVQAANQKTFYNFLVKRKRVRNSLPKECKVVYQG